jgi:hypothetical protein
MSDHTGPSYIDGYVQIGDGSSGSAIGAYAKMGDWLYVGFSFFSPDDGRTELQQALFPPGDIAGLGHLIARNRLRAGPVKRYKMIGDHHVEVPRRFCVRVSPTGIPASDAEFAFSMIDVNRFPKRHREYWNRVQLKIMDKFEERYEPF